MVNNNFKKLDIISETCLIEIEGKKYYIYESYIPNGSGYTFRIYANLKSRRERRNCFYSPPDRIVVVGKNHNYLLVREDKELKYEIERYTKDILKFEKEKRTNNINYYSIYLKNDIIVCFASDINDTWKKESEIRDRIVRKQKLINLNNA